MSYIEINGAKFFKRVQGKNGPLRAPPQVRMINRMQPTDMRNINPATFPIPSSGASNGQAMIYIMNDLRNGFAEARIFGEKRIKDAPVVE